MTAPSIPPINVFPVEGMIPTTYPEYVNKLKCSCPAGALIMPSPLPSATINLGDIIADQAKLLAAFTSAYGMITVIIKMIACIIEVLCALVNPFALVAAIIKLFGTCLPDFILIFPQFAIPAIIICVVKIILAVVEYILTVIIPLIIEIITNVLTLVDAFANNNQDAQMAIAFKIVSLFKELQNVLGILSALGALFTMIKALLSLGIGIPCSGSDACCNDANCPDTIKSNTELDGTDGILTVIYTFAVPLIYFNSPSITSNLKEIRDFFPSGFDYLNVSDEEKLPYLLSIEGSRFAMTGVDSNGTANLVITNANYFSDGYLINTDMNGSALATTDARFHTGTNTFQPSFVNTRYVILQDTRGDTQAALNNGTWVIKGYYGPRDVLLQKSGVETWSYWTGFNDIKWSMAPSAGSNKTFVLDIRHEELIRHNLIGVGCHPAVRATVEAVSNRFPQIQDTALPALPDVDLLISGLTNCITAVAPLDLNSQWVLDNYDVIATNIVGMESCIGNLLNNFKDSMVDYAKGLIGRVLDVENSSIFAIPGVQIIGKNIEVSVIPLDRNGTRLALGLPPGTLDVEVNASVGNVSPTTEVLDAYGVSTGIFTASLVSYFETFSQVGATVDGYDLSYFDGFTLQPRFVTVQFVEPSDYRVSIDGSTEPLGSGRSQ